jgi:1,5-anhydro-D-fructose reductase (1,5-anhydro-D-mannitol-forming)
VNFGIAGFGLHAVKRLMPGFAKSSKCKAVALSRRDSAKAHESAAQYNIPHAFASTDELCRCKDVDAVFVASPNSLHLPDVLTAVRHGKHVLCEKPMAMKAAECQQMVEAAHHANVLLGVAQVFRFEESTDWFRSQMDGGKIGVPIFARSEFSFLAGTQHPRTWIRDKNIAGGGPIADIGVHCIDALRFILRDEVVRVTARGILGDNGNVEDAATLLLEFSRETLGTVAVSFRAEYRTPLEIVGEVGVLRADDALTVDKPILLEFRRGGNAVETQTVNNALAYAKQVDAFADAVEGKAEFPAPGEEGWKNQLILDAAYRSMQTGKVEEVPVLTPRV